MLSDLRDQKSQPCAAFEQKDQENEISKQENNFAFARHFIEKKKFTAPDAGVGILNILRTLYRELDRQP